MAEQLSYESIDDLPEPQPFPAVAQRIMAACESPDIEPRELAEIIQCDPAVSLQLLKVANSSLYGFAGEIRSVEHAVVALGMRSVKDLSVSVAASAVFAKGGDQSVRRQIWLHSLACGTVAAQIAPHVNVAPSEAFLAGVVHDVGKLVLLDTLSDEYVARTKVANSSSIVDVENEMFGFNHQQVGARCADEWGLPIEVSAAIEFHHAPEQADVSEELAALICLSNSLSVHWRLGGIQVAEEAVDEVVKSCGFSLADDTLEKIQEDAVHHLNILKNACG